MTYEVSDVESSGGHQYVSPFDQIVYSEFDQRYIELFLIEQKGAMDAALAPHMNELAALERQVLKLDQLDIETSFQLSVERARLEYVISLVRLRQTVRCVRGLIQAGYRDSKACSDRREAQRQYDLQAGRLRQQARFYGLDVDCY